MTRPVTRSDVRPSGGRPSFPLLLLAALAAAGLLCPTPLHAAATARWTDALGRTITAPAPPRRIVSLVPSITEILFALGLGDRVAGVTRFCDFPPEARAKPRVGGYADPGVEAVVALAPDLVFASADSTPRGLVSRLEALGVPVYVVYPRNLSGALATIAEVGRVAGAPAEGAALGRALAERVAAVEAAVAGRPRPRVILCVMVQPVVVAGPGTLGDDLVRTAGGVNAVPAGVSAYPTWGPESLLAADPDVIVVSPHPGQPEPTSIFRAWPELRAVRDGRVVTVDADWVHRPGPRLAQGLEALARALHGDLP